MTEVDRPERSDPRAREILLLRLGIVVAVVVALATIAVAVWAVLDARDNADKIIDALNNRLASTQSALDNSQAEKAAVASVSLDTFLQQYNDHVAALKSANETYEVTKATKGSDIPGSDAAGALVGARARLYEATDNFTAFVDRWRLAAETFNKMLDGNVTRLENSRRENNDDDVHETARRIVNSAPGLATPLRVALDKLKQAPLP